MNRNGHPARSAPWLYGLVPFGVAVTLLSDRPLVNAVVVFGLGLVAPLALGHSGWWPVAAMGASIGLDLDEGLAATLLVLPAMAMALVSVAATARGLLAERRASDASLRSVSMREAALVLVPTWAVVAMASLMASTAEVELFDIGEPIVRLTAVHYLYAGVGALEVARRLHRGTGRWHGLATTGLVATAIAPPVVAAGFVLDEPLPQIGGAVLMTIGVWSSAAVVLVRSLLDGVLPRRSLGIIAGVTPWVPMVLAVSWAAALHIEGIPALSVPDMGRFHGLANGLGFVLAGLLATAPVETESPAAPLAEVPA